MKYPCATLYRGGPQKRRAVHLFVLEAFDGPCPPDHEGAHLNGNARQSNLWNLRWVTRKENARHKIAHGTRYLGSRHQNAVLDERKVAEIKRRFLDGARLCDVRGYGVGKCALTRIRNGTGWVHVKPAPAGCGRGAE